MAAVQEVDSVSTNGTPPSLESLALEIVAASLASTEILETVASKFGDRITGQAGSLLKAAEGYFSVTRGLLTREALAAILARNEPNPVKHQDYLALYDSLTAPPYSTRTDENHRWFLNQFDFHWQIQETGNILNAAAQAMLHGHESHGAKMLGASAAWQVLSEGRIDFETRANPTALSELEVTSAGAIAQREYAQAAKGGLKGLPMKVPEQNELISGYKPGAFHIYTAFAGEGKSFLMLNDAHQIWKTGGNVSLGTGEMSESECRARLYALHSCEPQFEHPILTKQIENGTLSQEDKQILDDVIHDIETNKDYGKFFVFQFPYRSTPDLIFNRFAMHDQIVPLNAVVVDYVGLLASERARVSRREELDDLIRQLRARALDFDKGRSIPCITGYQTNRQSFIQARSDGYYTLTCFAECAQAEQSATSATWALSLPNNPDQLKLGVLKNRGGELGEPFYVTRDFRHARIASLKSQSKATAGQVVASLLDL